MSTVLIILGVMFLIFHLAVLFVFCSNTGGLDDWLKLKTLPMAIFLCIPVSGTLVMCTLMFTYFVLKGTLK